MPPAVLSEVVAEPETAVCGFGLRAMVCVVPPLSLGTPVPVAIFGFGLSVMLGEELTQVEPTGAMVDVSTLPLELLVVTPSVTTLVWL